MSDDVLNVTKRETRGTREARRARKQGMIPAVLYGHGQESLTLAVKADEFSAAIRHGARLIDLAGAVNESALIRDIQWDTFASEVLHIDFTRASRDEKIEMTIAVELRGEAPGVRSGGVVEHIRHEVQITCPAGAIPDRLQANINSLELGQALTIADLDVPEGAEILADSDEIIVQCVEATEQDDDLAVAEPGEPEVIGRPASDEEEGND